VEDEGNEYSAARMLAVMESATAVFYVAVLIAPLVLLYSGNQPSPRSNP
jgi:hypothetical protein